MCRRLVEGQLRVVKGEGVMRIDFNIGGRERRGILTFC